MADQCSARRESIILTTRIECHDFAKPHSNICPFSYYPTGNLLARRLKKLEILGASPCRSMAACVQTIINPAGKMLRCNINSSLFLRKQNTGNFGFSLLSTRATWHL